MSAAAFITPADLLAERSADILAQLADDVNRPPQYAAAGTQAVLSSYCEQASGWVRGFIARAISDTTDAQATADLKRWAIPYALYRLYLKRNHFGPSNPYYDAFKATQSELEGIRDGKLVMGDPAQTQRTVSISTEDIDATYSRDSDSLLGRF